jgi:hypothetical protein
MNRGGIPFINQTQGGAATSIGSSPQPNIPESAYSPPQQRISDEPITQFVTTLNNNIQKNIQKNIEKNIQKDSKSSYLRDRDDPINGRSGRIIKKKPTAVTGARFDTVAFGQGLVRLPGVQARGSNVARVVAATGATFERGQLTSGARSVLGETASKAIAAILKEPTSKKVPTHLKKLLTTPNSSLNTMYKHSPARVDELIRACHKARHEA